MKFIYLTRAIAIFFMGGSINSIEHDLIDAWTGFLQVSLGITLLILSNFWMREVRKEIKNDAD
jgi:hypothetical protein